MNQNSKVAIVGGGICGLALALNLHRRGIRCRVFERVPEIKPLGVGITLLPHAMRELTALGLGDELLAAGIENRESCFFNRFGQLIYKEPRGKFAGYDVPEVGIHRGRLHLILANAVRDRLGHDAVRTNHECAGVVQDEQGVTVSFKETSTGRQLEDVRAEVVIACDGINSAIRKRYYPDEKLAFAGINSWRGVTRRKPILGGHTYMRIGSIRTGKIVIYPIIDNIDGEGNQLINWMADIHRDTFTLNDWNKPGNLADFLPVYKNWNFDWLDVAQMIRESEQILEYPMVDKDPIETWTFDRITLAGDAAHPMYPRGSNGAAQSLIDARTLADALQRHSDARSALKAYEAARVTAAANVVRTNRQFPPDFINTKVEELVGDRPFQNLDDYITQDELRTLSENYKRVAGFTLTDVTSVRPGL
ncbi:flavin-dependent oxidoreductase [Bradyrhizobium canariense]|uniref:2-polyprenyl-6-methoxyphenol hydroxylase n=1 Tax=Bradyrhizobium canariense TaxID=255045 RepID=A0A1H1VBM2_9BRAD|nr:flavin-dependent oxidoreductase [Bradyrhizobium canariense]SDS81629.1 2-polyprenyl-6-methoxyphenol hydroxylase [Bradyrhizobium canariense]